MAEHMKLVYYDIENRCKVMWFDMEFKEHCVLSAQMGHMV